MFVLEMGTLTSTKHPNHSRATLMAVEVAALDEYLRFGLEAGTIEET